MKLSFLLISFLLSSTAHATCPNLAGHFTYTSSETGFIDEFIITQSDRDGLVTYLINYNEDYTTAMADGEVRSTTSKEAGMESVSTDSFVCDKNALIQTFTEKVTEDATVITNFEGVIKFSLAKNSNLVVNMKTTDVLRGEKYDDTVTYKRNRSR